MDSSTQVSTIALAVSGASALIALVSLGWTIYTAVHLNTARISVAVAHENIVGAGPRKEVVSGTVTNVGRAPTKVLSIWISLVRGRGDCSASFPAGGARTRPSLSRGAYQTCP
jgi:hypothetical protein